MSFDSYPPSWNTVDQWVHPNGAYVVIPDPARIPGADVELIVPYRCDGGCHAPHVLGLGMTVEVAGLLIAAIRDNAQRTGRGAALVAATDQSAALLAEHGRLA